MSKGLAPGPWWHPRADMASLSPQARLIRAEARAARTSDPTGELQRMLQTFRLPAGYQRDQALYELAGFALAALQRTLRRAKRLHEVNESQFLEAVKRAAAATWGPVDFVPVRRRIRVGRLDRDAHPAIADHLVTTMPLIAAARSAFVQRVRAELEVEAMQAPALTGAGAEPVDEADSSMDPAEMLFEQPLSDVALANAERARVELDNLAARAGLSPRQTEALRLYRQFGPGHHEQVAQEMGIDRGACRQHYIRAAAKLREAARTA